MSVQQFPLIQFRSGSSLPFCFRNGSPMSSQCGKREKLGIPVMHGHLSILLRYRIGQIVLYLAISVDGYLADEQGGVGWLGGDGSEAGRSRQLPGIPEHSGRHRHGLDHLSPARHGTLSGRLAL